ncbi:MAG: DedA family protein [Dehalococcoidia bacterium]|nr:DedA family protein [Dehalococcoidia bacterium]
MEFLKDVPGTIINLLGTYNFAAVLLLVFLEEAGLPLPVSGDIILIITGYHVFNGLVNPALAMVAVELGSLGGASFLYFVGKNGGHAVVLKYGKYIRLSPSRVGTLERWFQRHSGLAIILGRMVPGLRPVISFAAGIFEVNYHSFVLYTTIGTVMWAVPFLLLGYFAGLQFGLIEETVHRVSQLGGAIIVMIVAVVIGVYYFFISPISKRNRQQNNGQVQPESVNGAGTNGVAPDEGKEVAGGEITKKIKA